MCRFTYSVSLFYKKTEGMVVLSECDQTFCWGIKLALA